jgi:AraC-like DNA-binding protein
LGCRSVYISVKGRWVDDLAEGLFKKYGPVVTLPPGSRALKIAREAILSAPLGFFHSPYASSAFACRFALGLMEDLEGPPPGGKSAMVESALAFMAKIFGEHRNAADLARGLGVSREHFTRGFKRQMGLGPGEYLLRTRLGEAATLLTQSALSHREIAARTGFSDPSTFARAFRRLFGASPEQWRKGPL